LALFSKESGALFLVILPLAAFARVFGGSTDRVTAKSQPAAAPQAFGSSIDHRLAPCLAACALASLAYLGVRLGVAHLSEISHPVNAIARASLWERCLTSPMILWLTHLRLLFPLQSRLTEDWVITNPGFSNCGLPLLAMLVIFSLQLYLLKRTGDRRLWFFAIWIWVGLLLHAQILVPLDGVIAERWSYFPALGWLGFLATLAGANPPSRLTLGLVTVALSLLAWRSFQRSSDWTDDLSINLHEVEINPNTYYTQGNVGAELLRRGQNAKAAPYLWRAVELNPEWGLGWSNLGVAFERDGDFRQAETCYRRAVGLGLEANAYQNLAALLYRERRKNPAGFTRQSSAPPVAK
jgi:hypothetical protein